MKFTENMRETLRREFPQFADMPEDQILALYEKGSLKGPNHGDLDNKSVLLFEDANGVPRLALSTEEKVDTTNIPFDLPSVFDLLSQFQTELDRVKRELEKEREKNRGKCQPDEAGRGA